MYVLRVWKIVLVFLPINNMKPISMPMVRKNQKNIYLAPFLATFGKHLGDVAIDEWSYVPTSVPSSKNW